ncbi:major facilitator superfamily domain-containing protein [Exophiala viscosa]|uniref:Major facilitator superfamily domain-containing protein n=1 Tax=Exophiala viscosa TaxID=2486360 RepID=A0AAN6DQD4_9EURO|nr:major facilitator superfamily domain-containing protein [Exophiala viscosa]KAI1628577.1 major facilitator superfamily domain-containing protein [Exophiala viscosa]
MTDFDAEPKDASPIQPDGHDVAQTAGSEVIDWYGPCDPENPYNWPLSRKWIITAVATLATFITTMNGTMITVAADAINQEFNVSDANFPNSYWPVTTWSLGGGISCLIILPLMEDFGVRPAFLTTYIIFFLFIIPQAVAQNFATLVVTRFFAGGCAAILSNTAAALIGNIWEGDRARTIPMSFFVTTYLAGASMGPVIGGVILQNLSWRWLSYMQLIWLAIFFPVYFFFFQESRGTVILQQRARKLQKAGQAVRGPQDGPKMNLALKMALSTKRPLRMLFTEPVLFVFTLWSSFMVGTVFVFTQSVEQVFSGLYGWNASQAGYLQAAIVIGELVGWTGVLLSAKLYFGSASRNTESPGTPIPEARLYVSVFGSFVGVAGGMFVYGWTSFPSVPWIAPAIGLAMVGAGIDVVVLAIADYVIDAYARYAGSAVAAVVLGENLFSAFLPLAAQPMYSNLDFRWASSLLGFLALGLSFAPVCILIWGRQLRARSPFMKEAVVEKRVDSDSSIGEV